MDFKLYREFLEEAELYDDFIVEYELLHTTLVPCIF